MYRTTKTKIELTREELSEVNELNEQYQSQPKSMSEERKERLWALMNKKSYNPKT